MDSVGKNDPFAILAEAVDLAVVMLEQGRVVYANSHAAKLFERPHDEVLGQELADLLEVPPPDPPQGSSSVLYSRVAVATGMGAMATGALHDLGGGRGLAVFKPEGSLADVGAMTAGLLHNLAGPLSVIRSTAELVGNYLERARKEEPLLALQMENWPASVLGGRDAIIEVVDRITESARHLLAKLRGEADRNRELLDLNQVLSMEIGLMENDMWFKHHVTTGLDLDPDLPQVRGLYSDFSQSFRNLLANASKAMAESVDKELEVSTGYDEQRRLIILKIVDSGHGIPPEIQDRIFDPFFTTGSGSRSSGLGLHSVRQLLLPYGVEFLVDSAPGRTAFTLEIPLRGGRPQ